jgi:hypothetical protein
LSPHLCLNGWQYKNLLVESSAQLQTSQFRVHAHSVTQLARSATPSVNVQSSVSVRIQLVHWTAQSASNRRKYKKEIRVEERLSFPEARNKYFKLQPEPMKVTYAQPTTSLPPKYPPKQCFPPCTWHWWFALTNLGRIQKQQTRPNNHRPTNQENSSQPNTVPLNYTSTLWMATGSPSHPARIYIWTHMNT